MKTTTMILSGAATLALSLAFSSGARELAAHEAKATTGGLPLPGMRCVTIGDCTIWNLANMNLCPDARGCTVCDSEDPVRGCFIGSASDTCDFQGAATTDCGGAMTGQCDPQDNCSINLTPVNGSSCNDGPKCSSL